MKTPCTLECWAQPECARCRRRKAPRGRSVPLAAATGYCSHDCDGYYERPYPGHYWPEEETEKRDAARKASP